MPSNQRLCSQSESGQTQAAGGTAVGEHILASPNLSSGSRPPTQIGRCGDGKLLVVLVRRGVGGLYGGELVPCPASTTPGRRPGRKCAAEGREEISLTSERVELLGALPAAETRTTSFRMARSWPGCCRAAALAAP